MKVFALRPRGVLFVLPLIIGGMCALTFSVFDFGEFSVQQRMRAMRRSLSACMVLYWLVGVLGYCVYGDDTAGDVLRNMDGVLLGACLLPHLLHVCIHLLAYFHTLR
jgi:amino acid permease